MTKSILLFFLSIYCYSQNHTLSGVVFSNLNTPLESANIIAKPLQENAQLKFAIADNKGRYKLDIETTVKYEITVSYIGYIDDVFIVEPESKIITHNFILKESGEQLKEIVIKYNYQPIEIKKDTMTFDVKSFANGNERKMKEVLEKLPGVEVDNKGNVTVQGKRVTKMLVEGKSFFGGGTKLAVENIPADALDKIEVIDNFNEVGFMKKVSDSEDLAMNVKLKSNKKKFVFGDVETGVGVALNNNYLAHAGLFYYAPKANLSFIGDLNDIGKSTFTFEDFMRFGGGVSSFLSERKSFTDLYKFTNDNQDVEKSKSQFSAFNYSMDVIPKLSISGFSIFSKIFTNTRSESNNTYLQSNTIDFENKLQNGNSKSTLGISNVKLDYSPNKHEKLYYNAQYQFGTNDFLNTINSITNINSSVFETISKADNSAIKQYLEWHKDYNIHNITTFVVNQSYDNNKPINSWLTDQPFLSGLIPLQNDSNYNIEQIKKIKNNSIDMLFKHYWIINNFNHIYTNIGNNFINSNLETSEKQILTNGAINDFSLSGFGNNVKYQLDDAYIGLEYKFKISKWTNKLGLYYHSYKLKTTQINSSSISKLLFQPQFNSDYEFNKSETLNFAYKLTNKFPDVNKLANGFTLENYNSIFKGNIFLENEQYHTANLRYSKMNTYRGITWNCNANFNKKIKPIKNDIVLNGINQYSTPVSNNNPETNYFIFGSFSKKIYRFTLKFDTNLTWYNYSQTINNVSTTNNQENQNLGISIRTSYKKWADFNIKYAKEFSQFSGLTTSNYKSDEISSELEASFWRFWVYKLDYKNLKNINDTGETNFYQIANMSLRFQNKNNPFGVELIANNVFNIQKKNNYSFSDYIISQSSTYVLPRIILLSVSYKL